MTYKLITFDVFSALGDIQGTFIPFLETIPQLEGKDAKSVFQTWRSKQYEYMIIHNSLEREYMSFEEITRRTLDHTLYINNIDMATSDRDILVEMWRKINVWGDSKQVVQEVKNRGYQIGMLSNGDQQMLTDLAAHFDIGFDYIFSAEQVGCYKPKPDMYHLAYKHVGIKQEELLHVAGSAPDIVGAISSGTPCAWSNRLNLVPIDLSFTPTYTLKNLQGILSIL